jgi:hypothetical protein
VSGFLSAGDAHGKNGGHHGGKADSHQIHFFISRLNLSMYAYASAANGFSDRPKGESIRHLLNLSYASNQAIAENWRRSGNRAYSCQRFFFS